jgi:hypothetical protein
MPELMEHPWFLRSCLFKVVTKDGEINDEKAEGYAGYKLSTELQSFAFAGPAPA